MTLRLHLRPALLVVAACLVSVGCYGDVELEACTISETYCDDAEHTSGPGSSSAAVTDGSASPATTTAAASDAGATDTGETVTGGDIGTGETSGDEAGLPIDLPPAVWDLVCDPEIAAEVGPYQCAYQVSPDALEADLLDDGVIVATGPAGAPLVFPVTSAPHNNPGSELTVVVRDAAGQTAQASLYHPAVLLDPGSKVWTTQEPNDGMTSIARGVALQNGYVITAGSHWSNDKLVGTLRRYDKAGQYIASAEGWTRTHTDWTARPELKTAALTLMGVAVDAEQNIITVGTAYINDEPRMYVARFHADGTLHWEVLGEVPTEARAVGVQPDGTIWVAGDVRTGVGPEEWDLAVWVYGPDKQAHGQDIYNDPTDLLTVRSERGHAVAVLPGGRVVVAGTREVLVNDLNQNVLRGVALVYEGKGKRIGEWTSPGDKMFRDEILAAVATDTGVALCGYAKAPPADPDQRPQILVRWHDAELAEEKTPRLEVTPGGGTCNAVGYNREGATIVGATVSELGQGNNQWIFAVRDA
ncbi:MAG: hypothetical protein JNL82_41030, partial [Myxococcales bacterium]|nr:hypothetical protein [Myxococcales bacterium]